MNHIIEANIKIAIVVPVYNVARYIDECLQSILAQTYQNWICIVVDDGSTDSSGQIAENYANLDGRFFVIHKINGGFSDARNTALDFIKTSGRFDYVCFCDSDDVMHVEMIERLLNTAIIKNADIVTCNFHPFPFSNKDKCLQPSKQKLSPDDFVELIFSVGPWENCSCSGGMVWKSMFKANLLTDIRFNTDRNFIEDELFCVKAALNAKDIFLIPDDLYGYRKRSGSAVRDLMFTKKLLAGRELCIPIAKKISKRAYFAAISAYVNAYVRFCKDNHNKPDATTVISNGFLIDACKQGLLHPKTYKQYKYFSDNSFVSMIYLIARKGIHSVMFWKRLKNKQSEDLFQ